MIYIKSDKAPYGVQLPTSISEVTAEALTAITDGIKLPKYHCIVALCFKTKLSTFAIAVSNKRSSEINVVPVLAKIADEDSKNLNAVVGDSLIVDRSALERGSHINCATVASSNAFRNYLNNDNAMVSAIVTNKGSEYGIDSNSPIIVMEFKIIPVSEIRAAVSIKLTNKDPYKVIEGGSC